MHAVGVAVAAARCGTRTSWTRRTAIAGAAACPRAAASRRRRRTSRPRPPGRSAPPARSARSASSRRRTPTRVDLGRRDPAWSHESPTDDMRGEVVDLVGMRHLRTSAQSDSMSVRSASTDVSTVRELLRPRRGTRRGPVRPRRRPRSPCRAAARRGSVPSCPATPVMSARLRHVRLLASLASGPVTAPCRRRPSSRRARGS